MFSNFTSLVPAFVALSIIIAVHEFGHFFVAKLFRIRVDVFSIGFGPRLLGFRRGETDYRISAFPLGGYVRMAGENPDGTETGAPDEFLSKPRWQRFLVAVAGPAINVVLAVGLLTGLFMYGMQVPAFSEGAAIVGTVEEDSVAEAAGIRPGDRILEIDGKEQPDWAEVEARIVTNADRTVALTLDRGGEILKTQVIPVRSGPSQAGSVGMYPHLRETNVIEGIVAESPAEIAGLRPLDEITSVNGVEIKNASAGEVRTAVESIPDTQDTFPVTLVRNGESLEVQVGRMDFEGRKVVGISGFVIPTVLIRDDFQTAMGRSIDKNLEYGTLVFQVLQKLMTGGMSMKSVDGPIGIIRVAGRSYESGLTSLMMLMAMISLNLGLMNLLPIPILDGGVMLMLTLEGLMRRDFSVNVRARIAQVSFVFLLTLMFFVILNDVVKLLPLPGKDA